MSYCSESEKFLFGFNKLRVSMVSESALPAQLVTHRCRDVLGSHETSDQLLKDCPSTTGALNGCSQATGRTHSAGLLNDT